jgi:hypothetical protein
MSQDHRPDTAARPRTAVEALMECGMNQAQAKGVLDDLNDLGWTVRPESMRMGDHVEVSTKMRDGKTYCACGNPWPCPRAYPECSWHPGERHGICSEAAR